MPSAVSLLPWCIQMNATAAELARVKNFALWKPGYGRVTFDVPGHEYTDVRDLDLRNGMLPWAGQLHSSLYVSLSLSLWSQLGLLLGLI